ncbi:DUF4145 domain-containing protein [Paenibacillus illinoisensis]|uniref:DUF4145 domain-containing protein n=1 Tax=Paenibacillus illinoisensis TaxID=59845 RepID=UPI001C8CFBC1|nr:DUF4145 domain-containing protein [Paenibacillus illinoisensis]MBY0217920.1 DUF4145 domain-containing protein [Paenibacillus illinoisensis]
MQLIDKKQIVKHEKCGDTMLPKSIDKKCGHCARIVNFNLDWYSDSTEVMFTTSRCSGCGEISRFYLVEIKENEDGMYTGDLYISPVAFEDRKMIEGIEITKEFSESMFRAYKSAVNVYNLGEWSATVVLCRRLLEGITKSLLPESEQGKPLYRQLELLSSHVELQKPILTLAHAIRVGGNLGAHFDLEREPDESLSRFAVDLLDYIIEYLYILPRRIEQLHTHIEELPNKIN